MKRWTKAEEIFAVTHCTCWTDATIGQHLGRSAWAVRRKLWELHQAATKQHYWTSGQVANLTGYSRQWITMLIRQGKIKARRVPGGKWWLINDNL